ncbi:nitrate reductase cytochrome c-type subunit [Prosthecomicrobium sp. N25]|uniref:nitrate reductase cytochrome c-type subunit n=1 Tax=Prosthecomicrobium sp. N25 TaxID=3129254 RepID=UPI0030778D06
MNKFVTIATLAAALAVLGTGIGVSQQTGQELKGLRGGVAPEVDLAPGDVPKQDTAGRFSRAYRQQPPLIPHQIDRYQIDWRTNQCLGCHDWSVAAKQGAPTLSMTHYLDRDGRQLDSIPGTRWFCNQCHVPQADTKELVTNTFKPSTDVK